MLTRQRVLLYMLHRSGSSASRLQMMKWSFLLREESPGRGGSAFYQFLPYHYGPFSFCLYREASSMERHALIKASDNNCWRLTQEGKQHATALPADLREEVDTILNRYGTDSIQNILAYVYERYPWFTTNSYRSPANRVIASKAIYTAGYEGLHIDGFLNALLEWGIERVVDVRRNPVSRRYGFHKSTFARLCGKVGIEYCHFPEVGIASSKRQVLNTPDDYQKLFNEYEEKQLPARLDTVREIARLMDEKASVLVCQEASASSCHRSRLATACTRYANLPVKHLGNAA